MLSLSEGEINISKATIMISIHYESVKCLLLIIACCLYTEYPVSSVGNCEASRFDSNPSRSYDSILFERELADSNIFKSNWP